MAAIINNGMAATQTTTVVPVRQSTLPPTLVLLAGWLVPGLGHLLLKKPIRAALLFVSIVAMFIIGMGLHGKLYTVGGDMLDLLGFAGQMGSPLLWAIAHATGAGATQLSDTVSDYGSKFAVVAGLLNVMAAVDAQSLANGRKAGL